MCVFMPLRAAYLCYAATKGCASESSIAAERERGRGRIRVLGIYRFSVMAVERSTAVGWKCTCRDVIGFVLDIFDQ